MPINPLTGLEEELNDENFDQARRAQVEENSGYDFGGRTGAALAAISAGFMGRDPIAASGSVLDRNQKAKDAKLTALDKWKQDRIADIKRGRDDKQYAIDQEKLNRERDVNSEESNIARQAAKRMNYDGDLTNLTAEKFKSVSSFMKDLYATEQQRLARLDNREFQKSLFNEKRDDKQKLLDEKKEDRELKLAVPGYERTGEVLPKEEEAMKFRKATATSKQITDKLKRMRELVERSGSFENGGQDGTEMESLATEIQLLGKSPELYELGVLTGPDLNLLQKITADPTSVSSLFTRDSSRLKQIDSQIQSMGDKIGSTAQSMGYRQAGQRPQKQVLKTQTNPKTGEKRIVYTDGSTEALPSVAGRR